MNRDSLATWLLTAMLALSATSVADAQTSPFEIPRAGGGPIIGPDGKMMSAIDRANNPTWIGGIDFGLSGSEGNTTTIKARTGIDFRYDTPDDYLVINVMHILNRWNDGNIENKVFGLVRNEMPFDQSWGWYVQGQVEYDQFRVIDFRLAAHNGICLNAIRNDNNMLKLRLGAGVAREMGGESRDWVPEGQAGADYELKLSTRTRFNLAADYYPDLHELQHYRLRGRVSFDMLIDPDLNLFLRIGAINRYDSNPYGSKRNDLDYFATFQLRF